MLIEETFTEINEWLKSNYLHATTSREQLFRVKIHLVIGTSFVNVPSLVLEIMNII